MTQHTVATRITRILRRVRHEYVELGRAHEVMWDHLSRLDPDPSPYLHWEPSAYGWRLDGSLLPPDPADAGREAA